MNILVVGSGGREHAICDAFARSSRVKKIFCANGNAGITSVAECVDIGHDEINRLVLFAKRSDIGLTFVGGEKPLALGIVDAFEREGLRILGPTQSASRLESSKAFAKDFMSRHGIPTAAFATYDTVVEAVSALEAGAFGSADTAVVVKADGLAAGKGVIVAANRAEAIAAVRDMASLVGDDAAAMIVVEECLIGTEVSLLMFANGEDFILMPPVRDHKRIGEGDTGPNTGGMGTFTDQALLPHDEIETISDLIIEPTLRGCIADGFPFRGILFLGLMMTASGPRVLEYNVRFGDPETQSILIRLETDLLDICEAMLAGNLSTVNIEWTQGSSACVVLAAKNYPTKPLTGDVIYGVGDAEQEPDVKVFHAGTAEASAECRMQNAQSKNLDSLFIIHHPSFVTAAGRVLGVTATGDDLDSALTKAYRAAEKISFNGKQMRRDIGRTARQSVQGK